MPVSLNQYRGEIGSFYNRSTSQITDMTISLSNILLNFTKNVLVYIILLVDLLFLNASRSIFILQHYIFMEFYDTFILLQYSDQFFGKFFGKV